MKRGLFLLILLPALLIGQNICGFFNDSVIIENGEHIGNIGDVCLVVRESHLGINFVGKVIIRERFEDMVIADAIFVQSGYQIAVGDLISKEEEMAFAFCNENRPRNLTSQKAVEYNIHHHAADEKSYPFRRLRFGFSVGTLLPYQTFYEHTNYSYQVGPVLQYGFSPRSSVMFDCMYSFMDERSQPANMPHLNNQSVLNVNALFRHGLYHAIFIDLGAGVYIPRFAITATPDQRKINSLEYHYGVCAGLAINFIDSNALSMFISPRYHTYLMRKEMVENVSVGMNFIL